MSRTRWYLCDDNDELAQAAISYVSRVWDSNQWARARYTDTLRRIEPGPGSDDLMFRAAKAAAETVQADICGRQKPKAQFLTSGADWQIRRKARLLDKFVLGILKQPCGEYQDAWELGSDVFADAQYAPIGAIKVIANHVTRRVELVRVNPLEVLVDDYEASHGNARTLAHRYRVDKHELQLQFPDLAEALENVSCATTPDDWRVHGGSNNDRAVYDEVQLYELWRLGSGDDPGRHCIVTSCGSVVLVNEEWIGGFPFAFIRWTRRRHSWLGVPMADEVVRLEAELNESLDRISDAMRLRSGRRTYIGADEDKATEDALSSNEAEEIIRYHGKERPYTDPTPPLSDIELGYAYRQWSTLLESIGVSPQQATASKESGVTAAVAMMQLRDIGSQRQAMRVRAYERLYVDLAHAIVEAVRRLAEDDPHVVARFPGTYHVREIDWSDIQIEGDRYTVDVAPASMMPDTPAGRLELAQQLLSTGIIGPDAFRRILASLDLESELTSSDSAQAWLEELIDRFLDWDGEEDSNPYEPPESYLPDYGAALMTFGSAYFRAKIEGAPEHCLELMREYMAAIDALAMRELAKQQEAQQQATVEPGTEGAPPPGPEGPPEMQ